MADPDFYEIDMLSVEADKSGDAIGVRYGIDGHVRVHVIDAGFQSTGDRVVEHVRRHYADDLFIDHVVATHPDGDHAGGLRTVLEEANVLNLWMWRPWLYAETLIPEFPTYSSVDRLRARLRAVYPNLAALEDIAIERGIPIHEPVQGAIIGAFTVLAPTRQRYLDLVVASERTPESKPESERTDADAILEGLKKALAKAVNFVRGAWGEEVFSTEETSAENEMSVVQFASIAGDTILLTADAGRQALAEAIAYAPYAGLYLPGVARFQVPHHGSRRNVSSEVLDALLGPKHASRGTPTFTAMISSAKADVHHPRRSVVRAMVHRGANVFATEGQDMCFYKNVARAGLVPATAMDYPEDQEA